MLLRALLSGGIAVAIAVGGGSARSGSVRVPGFVLDRPLSAAGTVWRGHIPGADAPSGPGESFVYLPAHFSAARRFPVVYLLHGLPGTPRQYVQGFHLARVADRLIAVGASPFIAVVPYAGPSARRGLAEWAGRWEDYLVDDVLPWVDANLPAASGASGRVLAGLSAGGFGALDIGLRHPYLFGTLESWSGYFAPLRDGPFVHATAADLAAHDPALIVRREARLLRRLGTRFELSTGAAHGRITPSLTSGFAAELRALRLPLSVWHVPRGVRGPGYALQLQHGLAYALRRSA